MKNDKIVTINGQKYDSDTGLPISTSNNIRSVSSIAQRTQSLYKRVAQKKAMEIKSPVRKSGRSMDIARSKNISHFVQRPKTIAIKTAVESKKMDIGPAKHHLAARVAAKSQDIKKQSTVVSANKPAKQIKDEAITKALTTPKPKEKKEKLLKKHSRFINIFSIGILAVLIVGYFVYVNMPSISVRVASAQAGINAKYPEYHPDGYSIDGPVSYSEGEVTIKFHANTGNTKFVIKQSKSTWDSSAVKNKVAADSNGEFVATEVQGLTIFTYNGNATWVNGGILYSISGDAKLNNDQIRRIATSL